MRYELVRALLDEEPTARLRALLLEQVEFHAKVLPRLHSSKLLAVNSALQVGLSLEDVAARDAAVPQLLALFTSPEVTAAKR